MGLHRCITSNWLLVRQTGIANVHTTLQLLLELSCKLNIRFYCVFFSQDASYLLHIVACTANMRGQ
jgi:hypothetical protein